MKITTLTRAEFLDSILQIHDIKSLKFAKETLDLWDNYYSWEQFQPLCLEHDEEGLCYLFYTITKDNSYLIIHRLLTPFIFRRKNYALEMMSYLFSNFSKQGIERFKMNCMTGSLHFYNKLGLNYWGVNEQKQYYCDFKMPNQNISELSSIVNNTNINELSIKQFQLIAKRLQKNGSEFTQKEISVHQDCLKLLKTKYRYDEVIQFQHTLNT